MLDKDTVSYAPQPWNHGPESGRRLSPSDPVFCVFEGRGLSHTAESLHRAQLYNNALSNESNGSEVASCCVTSSSFPSGPPAAPPVTNLALVSSENRSTKLFPSLASAARATARALSLAHYRTCQLEANDALRITSFCCGGRQRNTWFLWHTHSGSPTKTKTEAASIGSSDSKP